VSTVCIIISTPPAADPEAIELALALATFDHDTRLIFTGAGIGWLIKKQNARKVSGKSPASVIKALPMYDCDQVFYSKEDAEKLGFGKDMLFPFAQAVGVKEIRNNLNSANHCLSF